MTGTRCAEPHEGSALRHCVLRCDGERLSCTTLLPPEAEASSSSGLTAVFLHGAGTSDQTRFTGLMNDVASCGHQALAFDFSGHGASSGRLRELSLRRRFVQARTVIERHVSADRRLVLIGFSMSGQTVADLVGHYGSRVAAVGLCAPAVYAADAWPVPFGAGFTEIIRTQDSWRDSPALNAFAELPARAVLATPVTDEVIPPAVTDAVATALAVRARFTRLRFPQAGHGLGLWFAENAVPRRHFVDTLFTDV